MEHCSKVIRSTMQQIRATHQSRTRTSYNSEHSGFGSVSYRWNLRMRTGAPTKEAN